MEFISKCVKQVFTCVVILVVVVLGWELIQYRMNKSISLNTTSGIQFRHILLIDNDIINAGITYFTDTYFYF